MLMLLKNSLTLIISILLCACTLSPTKSNYFDALKSGDLDAITELEKQNYKILNIDKGETKYPIHIAARLNHSDLIGYLVSLGYNIDGKDNNSNTPLMVAVINDNFETARKLLELKANVNALGKDDSTALSLAISRKMTWLLLNHNANVELKNNKGFLISDKFDHDEKIQEIIDAEKSGTKPIFRYIDNNDIQSIKEYAASGQPLDFSNEYHSPLSHAIKEKKSIELIKLLLDLGANPEYILNNNLTVLHTLPYLNKSLPSALVQLILQYVDNVDIRGNARKDVIDITPVMISLAFATKTNNYSYAEALLKKGADINSLGFKPRRTVFHYLVYKDKADLKSIEKFVSLGADINIADDSGYTPLYHSIIQGNNELFDYLIAQGAQINHKNKHGESLLHIATGYSNLHAIKKLLTLGADVNQLRNDNSTPLHIAVLPNNLNGRYIKLKDHKIRKEVLKYILESGGNPISDNTSGNSPLSLAINKRDKDFAKLMLTKSNVNIKTGNGYSLIHLAVKKNDLAMIDLLSSFDADMNMRDEFQPKDKDSKITGDTPLHSALRKNNSKVALLLVKKLVSKGSRVNKKNSKGFSPLSLAANNNHLSSVEYLINNKATINETKSKAWGALLHAAYRGNTEIVRVLLKAGAKPDIIDTDDFTPLMAAVEKGHIAVVKELISKKQNLNLIDSSGDTALHIAVKSNSHEITKLLLGKKSKVNTRNKKFWSPLMSAVENKDTKMVSMLLAASANTNLVMDDGWSALHLTANNPDDTEHDLGEIATLLLKHGADSGAKLKGGKTPMMLAASNNKPNVVKALILAGVDINKINRKNNKSAFDYAKSENNQQVLSHLVKVNALSGLEQARYPSAPAAKAGYRTCRTKCTNGLCYRTYSDGKKNRFQAERKYNAINNQWEWDSGSC